MPNLSLDGIDRRILKTLQGNARIRNVELAEEVGLSPSPCLRRVRALESAARKDGSRTVAAQRGETRLFICAPYEFQVVDALLTNFHLPQSTLLMLVCAFAGSERILRAYATAIERGFRFYSYGDAMLIV